MIEFAAALLIALGVLFFAGTAVGVVRFPDFYTRMHAAAKGDTLSTFLILLGVAIYYLISLEHHSILLGFKVIFISIFLCITGPAAAHALIDAGFEAGLVPWQKPNKKKHSEEQGGTDVGSD